MSVPLPVLTPRRRSRLPLWIGLGVLALVLIVLVTVGYLASVGLRVSDGWQTVARTLPFEEEKATKQGLPLEPEDLRPTPPVPSDKNAALIYRKIDALYHHDSDARREAEGDAVSEFMRPKTRNQRRKEVDSILLHRRKMMGLAEQATSLAVCDFDRPWKQGIDTPSPELPAMRNLARLFAARSIRNLEAGNPKAALRDVAFGAKIGGQAEQDRFTIAFLVRVAIQAIMNRPFVEILQKYGDNAEVLRLADETQRYFGETPDLRDCFLAEIVMLEMQMELYRDPSVPTPDGLSKANLPVLNEQTRAILVDAWKSRLIAFECQLDSSVKASHGNLRDTQIAWQKIMEKELQSAGQPGYEINALIVPTFAKVAEKAMLVGANYQLRNQMVALLEYKIKTRDFPASLESLPKEKQYLDPFNNKPLIYRKTQNGFLLYSVSVNLTDDDGADTRDKNKNLLDVVVRYP